ncbi:MAG TPA: DUF58 domain-containing protein [Myxococcota bacterium]|jgi:uncharacterized protein (DUF58 family)|nr:DUF58 domain-containing protein [Myxococcota bacterium]
MIPYLSPSGRFLLAVAAMFSLAGVAADSWVLFALGLAPLGVVLTEYLAFLPAALMFRRRRIEMMWWIPAPAAGGRALVQGQPFDLRVRFLHRGFVSVPYARWELFSSTVLRAARQGHAVDVALAPGTQTDFDVPLLCDRAGHWVLHGATLTVSSSFDLWRMHVYFPSALGLTVLPPLAAAGRLPWRTPLGTPQDRAGRHRVRVRGLGAELREIREYVPGDAFKSIAWKATARLREIMVRELESEISIQTYLVVDAGPSMRVGAAGRAPLDWAISVASGLFRAAERSRDRIGLMAVDGRVLFDLSPGEGPSHHTRMLAQLLELWRRTDEDLTDLTEGELVELCAKYAFHQEGRDFRARPPGKGGRDASSAAARAALVALHGEGTLVVGPGGALYDLDALARWVTGELEKLSARETSRARRTRGGAAALRRVSALVRPFARDARMEEVRRYCALRGIEVPYRETQAAGGKETGLGAGVAAATTATRGSQLVVVLSDLYGLRENEPLLRAVRLARSRHHAVIFLAPDHARFAAGAVAPGGDEQARALDEALGLVAAREAARQRRGIAGALRRLGVGVIPCGPADAVSEVLRRLGGARTRAA